MNKWIGTGRPVADPEIRMYGANNDKKAARYRLAVDRGVKRDPNNPEQQTADFITCICYGYNADFADNYIRKGIKLLVEGRIQTGKYTNKDGQTVFTTEVVVDRHEFCESKGSNQNDSHQQAQQPKTANAGTTAPQALDSSFVNIPESFDGEVPFE